MKNKKHATCPKCHGYGTYLVPKVKKAKVHAGISMQYPLRPQYEYVEKTCEVCGGTGYIESVEAARS